MTGSNFAENDEEKLRCLLRDGVDRLYYLGYIEDNIRRYELRLPDSVIAENSIPDVADTLNNKLERNNVDSLKIVDYEYRIGKPHSIFLTVKDI